MPGVEQEEECLGRLMNEEGERRRRVGSMSLVEPGSSKVESG